MAAIGIDYGTSNSEVVFFDGNHHSHVKLDPQVKDGNKIRSSIFIYYPDELPTPPDEIVEAKVAQLQRTIGEQIEKEKQRFYEAQDPNEQQVYSDRIESLRGQFHDRPGLQKRAIQLLLKDLTVQDLSLKQLVETGTFAFGEEGFRRFLATPEKGRLIYSPKNFLGASLDSQQQEAFVGMIAKQLGYFRECAETQLQQAVDTAVIGRPVKFHGTRGETGNVQAINIMQQAAALAGFKHVSFLEEPIAAAYRIERTLATETTTLVVDVGGGTTDICCIRLGPESAQPEQHNNPVLGVTGKRLGGMECDKNLVLKAIAPHLGQGLSMQNGLPVPPTYFSDMCAVDDIPKLTRFFSDEYGLEIMQTKSIVKEPELLERLLIIQEEKLSARVVNSARMAKELLSSKAHITLPLPYIEPDFSISIDNQMLAQSMKSWLSKVIRLIEECLAQTDIKPEVVMITGGMSLSPILRDTLSNGLLAGLPLLENDAFNSVCEGLAIQAYRVSGADTPR